MKEKIKRFLVDLGLTILFGIVISVMNKLFNMGGSSFDVVTLTMIIMLAARSVDNRG